MSYPWVLKRALMAGLLIGVLSAAYMFTVVAPVVDRAIALEESMSAVAAADQPAADAGHHEEPLYARDEQKGGGVAAMALFALVLGLVFGTLFAARRHVLPGATDYQRAVWLSLVGFAAFAVIPAIKYPANPPAVGDPETVGERSAQYVAIIVVSVVLVVLLSRLSLVLRSRIDDPTRVTVVSAAAVIAFGLVVVLMPDSPDAIDPAVPAALVWDFRLRSLGGLALLWIGFGLGFGWLLTRAPDTVEGFPDDRQLVDVGS
jgi:predicted cobalt transporter CbtA